MLSEALSIALIARQFGRQIALDKVEADINGAEITTLRDFTSYFFDEGIRVSRKKISVDSLVERSYLFPCVVSLTGDTGIVATGFSEQNKMLSYVDPTNPSSGTKFIALEELREISKNFIWLVALASERDSLARPFDWTWFMPELFRYRWTLIFIFLLSLGLHVLSFTPILYLQISLDKVVGYGASETLNVLTIGVIGLLLMNALMTVGRDYIVRFIGQAVEARLLTDAFDKLLRLPVNAIHDGTGVSAERRVSGGSNLRRFVIERVISTILDVSSVLIFVPILFLYSYQLGLLVIIFLMLQVTMSLGLKRLETLRRAKVASAESLANETLRETFWGIDVVKALSMEGSRKKMWRSAASELIKNRESRDWVMSINSQSSTFLQQAMTVAILFFGINLVFGGELMAGALIAVNMVAGRVINPINRAVGLLPEVERINRIRDEVAFVWNEKPERQGFGKEIRVRGSIAFKNVSVSRSSEQAGLTDVSISIRPGERVALLGSADCGSDLIISSLIGNSRPSKGMIEIDNQPLTQLSLEHYRNQVSLLDANPRFFRGTIDSNIRSAAPNISSREFEEALEISGLSAVIEGLPDGLNTLIDASASSLPISHRLKLSLARGVAVDPAIILVSGGFDGMDGSAQLKFVQNWDKAIGNRTLIMATQQLSLAVRFDKIVVFSQGRVVSQGNHEQLLRKCERYNELIRVERRVARELWAELE